MEETEVLNFKEAAEFLRIGRNTLLKMVHEGKIPAQRAGRQWRFSKEALIEWLKSGQAQKPE
ncbi:MAG: helix-turn-helix domain-containing protein [Eubacteriales bacterium]